MLKEDTLSHYKETYQIEWASNLPENCPPERIIVPENEEFYRLLLNQNEITEEDRKPYVELYPDQIFVGKSLIQAHGLSVLKIENCESLSKLPGFNKHFKGIAKVTLNPTDGVLQKTGSKKEHYTWWRTTSFDESSAEIINHEEA